MGKKSNFGKVTKPVREKPRKRPGRHSKKPNKKRRKKPYNGQGRACQTSLDILYITHTQLTKLQFS